MSSLTVALRRLALPALVAVTGCAGARTDVVAPTATVPLSLSRAVRDASGTVVGEDRREVVGQLDADGTAWGVFYSSVKLTPEMDVSQAVNQEVARLHGDAVINLTISTRQCGFNWAVFANVLPFWPGCADVHVHGDVIRVRDVVANAPPIVATIKTAAPLTRVATNVARRHVAARRTP